jgi:hypothetical protein
LVLLDCSGNANKYCPFNKNRFLFEEPVFFLN